MSLRRFIRAVVIGIVLTVVLGLIGGILSGGGHNMIPMIILFPYHMYLIFGLQIEAVPMFAGMILLCVQFVAYAVITAFAQNRRQTLYLSAILLVVHTLAVVFSYSAYRASEKVGQLENPVHNVYDGA